MNKPAAATSNSKHSWTTSDFTSIQAIGSGKFGKVFKAVEKRSQKPVALKVVVKATLEKFDFFSQMKKELEIQWRLNHPNIVRLYGYFYDEQNIYSVLEFCPGGNLFQRLRRERYFDERKAKFVIAQIVEALIYLQDRNIIHRDIKPENILISDLERMHVKLCDFGWSTHTIDE
jgi:aurora kinase